MAKVLVTFRVMPEGVETNLDEIAEKIKDKLKPDKIEKIPIAFGLNALKVTKFLPEEEGEMERAEKIIKSIQGVSEVEVLEVSRSL